MYTTTPMFEQDAFNLDLAEEIMQGDNIQQNGGGDDGSTKKNTKNATEVLTYGLTIVHCKEIQMEWIQDIPADWKLTIYETCGQSVSHASSQPFKNAGSEECSAYLTSMIGQYDNLPDINIFLQSDVLLSHGKGRNMVGNKKLFAEHSPFTNFTELVQVVKERGKFDYLAFGPSMSIKKNIARTVSFTKTYHRDLFDAFGLRYTSNSTNIQARSGACFAVHKDRILAHSMDVYRTLRTSILAKTFRESKRQCSAFESTWHAILGEEYIIPRSSTLDDRWDELHNFVGGWNGNFKMAMTNKTQVAEGHQSDTTRKSNRR
jgi:hypothetical protein